MTERRAKRAYFAKGTELSVPGVHKSCGCCRLQCSFLESVKESLQAVPFVPRPRETSRLSLVFLHRGSTGFIPSSEVVRRPRRETTLGSGWLSPVFYTHRSAACPRCRSHDVSPGFSCHLGSHRDRDTLRDASADTLENLCDMAILLPYGLPLMVFGIIFLQRP
jgi:hypothetical protein